METTYAKYTKIDPQSALEVLGPKQKRKRGEDPLHKCPVCHEHTLSVGPRGFSCFVGGCKSEDIQQAFNLQAAGHDPEKFYRQPKEEKNVREKGEPRGFEGLLQDGHPEVKKLAERYGISEILARLNFGYSADSKALEDFLGYWVESGVVGKFGAGLNNQNQVRVLGQGNPKWMSCKSDATGAREFFKPRLPGNVPEYKNLYQIAIADKTIPIAITEGPGKTLALVENTKMATYGAEGVSNVLSKPQFQELTSDRSLLNIVFDADSEANWMVARSELEVGKAALSFGTKEVIFWKWDAARGKGFDDLIIFCRDNGSDWQDEITKYSYSDYLEIVRTRFPEKMAEWECKPARRRYNPEPEPFFEPDPDEYREYQEYLEFLEFSDDQDLKRKRELWIDQKIKSSRRRWKRSLKFTADYVDGHHPFYVDSRVFSPKWGSVAVRAPMGSGKTEALTRIVDHHRANGLNGLLLGSRNSCLVQTCDRLGFPHLLFEGNGGSLKDIRPGDFWGHCVDSLPRWAEADKRPEIVILDEISSLIPHALVGSTIKQNREHTLKLFATVLKTARYVYLLDANLKDWEVDYLEALSGKTFKRVEKPRNQNETPLFIYNFIGSSSSVGELPELKQHIPSIGVKEAITTTSYGEDYKANDASCWRESFLQLSNRGPAVVFSDSLKENKRLILLKHQRSFLDFYTGLQHGILRIDSETRNFPEVRQFMQSPVKFLIQNSITELYCSPSVESGISIKFDREELEELGKLLDDTRDYFVGFWLYNCHLPNEPITQMLLRVRDRNCPRYIFARTFAPIPKLDTFSELEKSYLLALNQALREHWDNFENDFINEFAAIPEVLTQQQNITERVSELMAGAWNGDNLLHHKAIQKLKAQQSFEKSNLRGTLSLRLQEDGNNIVDVLGGINGRSLKGLTKTIAKHRAGEIFNAPDTWINEDGFKVEMNHAIATEWSRGYLVEMEKRLIAEKWLFCNSLLPGIQESNIWSVDFLAEFSYLKPKSYSHLYYRQVLEHTELFKSLSIYSKLATLEQKASDLITDLPQALNYVNAIKRCDIDSVINDGDTIWNHDDETLAKMAKSASHKSKSIYFGSLGKKPVIKFLGSILERFGKRFKEVGKGAKGGTRKYQVVDFYKGCDYVEIVPCLIVNKYRAKLEDLKAQKVNFANNNPQDYIGQALDRVAEHPIITRKNQSSATQLNDHPASDTAIFSQSQEFSEVKAKSTPHNPEDKTQFNDGDRLTTKPTPREELETWQIEQLEAHGIAI